MLGHVTQQTADGKMRKNDNESYDNCLGVSSKLLTFELKQILQFLHLFPCYSATDLTIFSLLWLPVRNAGTETVSAQPFRVLEFALDFYSPKHYFPQRNPFTLYLSIIPPNYRMLNTRFVACSAFLRFFAPWLTSGCLRSNVGAFVVLRRFQIETE